MERISVFDIFKIGVGPSSSHTMGPWRAAQRFVNEIRQHQNWDKLTGIKVQLYGSLAKTGKGHGTDLAILLGLSGFDPVDIPTENINAIIAQIRSEEQLLLGGIKKINFKSSDIVFFFQKSLPFHANALSFEAFFGDEKISQTYYSVGGGFVVKEGEQNPLAGISLPFPIDKAQDLLNWCQQEEKQIWEIVLSNEKSWRNESKVYQDLEKIWDVMQNCIYKGAHTEGILAGGLQVMRRAKGLNAKLLAQENYTDLQTWKQLIRAKTWSFGQILQWVSCFALAVNEENAAFGRVVTAPTNGAAGVIPAVLMYHVCFSENFKAQDIPIFLLTAGELGSLFKKGATISAAMGGCQAEIGVSSAMAAGGLTACLGGSAEQILMATEIAMEHHLGLTCDPIGGLVQIPCIERNSMGAVKAITAAQIALEGNPKNAKVSLDAVIKTMKETAQDMNHKYKETSEGGLALEIPVNLAEC